MLYFFAHCNTFRMCLTFALCFELSGLLPVTPILWRLCSQQRWPASFFWFFGVEMTSFLDSNGHFRGENAVGGVGIVWMVASSMCRNEIGSSSIPLAFSFAISEISCFIWSCISLYCVLFSVVIVSFMDDVAWLLPCDVSLVLTSSCCAIDAWFLPVQSCFCLTFV